MPNSNKTVKLIEINWNHEADNIADAVGFEGGDEEFASRMEMMDKILKEEGLVSKAFHRGIEEGVLTMPILILLSSFSWDNIKEQSSIIQMIAEKIMPDLFEEEE